MSENGGILNFEKFGGQEANTAKAIQKEFEPSVEES